MDVTVQAGRLTEVEADAIVVNLFQGVMQPGGATRAVDSALRGAISRLIALGDFTGRLNQTAVLYPDAGGEPAPGQGQPGVKARRVLLVGLGKPEEFTLDRVRQVAATAARRARGLGVRTLATVLHGAGAGGIAPREAAQAIVEGSILGLYRFDELKSRREDEEEPAGEIERLTIVELDSQKVPEIEAGTARGRILAESACFARTLVVKPGNMLSPRALAEAARQMAAETGLRCEVLEPAQIEALGMGAFLGVARGSEEPCRFIILEHVPQGTEGQPPLVLCGKAITFDSGGISIKPGEGMWQMKDDMAGGAAVIGALRALALLGVRRRVVGLVPATENMPSGRAFRPGDVLRAMDGQTIEVISTDAEGRLVLADALAYGHRYQPAAMVDVATLTGGVVTALGHGAAGVMGNDADVIARLKRAGEATGERVWELPLWDDAYKRAIRSDIADMKNTGTGRAASPIAGAMLLKQFAKRVPWAHVDIAGMSWADTDTPYTPKGATGYGVRLLVEFVASYDVAESAPSPAAAAR
jgi:leucyl aminopeptidase